jgi:ACS family tartrate transporter-like MFS transporter
MTMLPRGFVDSAGTTAGTNAVRKATGRLVPFLLVLYIVAWLDRVNVGFAALQMNRALGFSAAVYGFGAGVFFVSYALCEVPSNLVLYRVGARRWIARIMITWGLLSAAMMLVRGPMSFYGLRFLLGAAEAGFFPGIIFYLGNWFPRAERAKAMAGFTAAIPLSSVVGGPLAALLLSLHGSFGLAGWQWLFLMEGIPAVILGIAVLVYLPDGPADARWLTAEERAWLIHALQQEGEHVGGSHTLVDALAHPTVWRLAIVYCLGSIGSYGLTLWMPEILQGLSGLSNVVIGLISALPYVVAAIATVVVGGHSDRTRERRLHVAISCFVGGAGFAASAMLREPWLAMVALTVAAAGTMSRNGPFWALPSLFLHGRAAAGGIAFINTLGALGGFIGPYVIGLVKSASGSFTGGLLFLAAALTVSGIIALGLRGAPERADALMNRRRASAAPAPES